jgi:hypothetical protein
MRHHFLATAFLALSLAACATGDDADDVQSTSLELCSSDTIAHPEIENIVLGGADTLEQSGGTSVDPRNADPYLARDNAGGAVPTSAGLIDEQAPTACACENDQCLVNWVSDNVGCNVCVHIMCETGDVGVCNPCLDNAEPIADEPCALPETGSLGQ